MLEDEKKEIDPIFLIKLGSDNNAFSACSSI